MSMNNSIADMLTRIRNAHQAMKKVVKSPSSKFRKAVLDVLVKEGYIAGYTETPTEIKGQSELEVELKYYEGAPVIKNIRTISNPGRRVYTGIKKLPRHANGLGVTVLSTPAGVMSDNEARERNLGGEVICVVF